MYRSALRKAQVGQKATDARRRPQAAMAWQQQTVTKGYKMLQNATKCYKRRHGLTVEQQNAIDQLLAGDTDVQGRASPIDRSSTPAGTGSKRRVVAEVRQASPNRQAQGLPGADAILVRAERPLA
ncbi:MAG TPA: hypothetical protein VG125_03035 [Pirellulales bacterium]|jgi:hypothetical protein|nr:hypothetical protein [Pirellulales bacterium]